MLLYIVEVPDSIGYLVKEGATALEGDILTGEELTGNTLKGATDVRNLTSEHRGEGSIGVGGEVEHNCIKELQETAVGIEENRADVGKAEGGGRGVALGYVDKGIGYVLMDTVGGINTTVTGHGIIEKGCIYS